ncbi:MAG: hypothetical protein V4438_03795, partial [Patescibacteria group bacterium]
DEIKTPEHMLRGLGSDWLLHGPGTSLSFLKERSLDSINGFPFILKAKTVFTNPLDSEVI